MTAADASRRVRLDDFRHIALAETLSTNSECVERARKGDPGNIWITAARQTGGRGRRGRAWVSEAGNLYASLLLIDPAPMDRIQSLPLAVAVAVRDAVQAVMPPGSPPVMIKWPNDILIDRKKTCGILLEGESLPDGRHALVIGCGINVAHAPDAAMYPITSLRAHGSSVSPEELFAHLFRAMADALALWNRGQGLPAIIERWKASAGGIGEKITVNLSDRSISGQFTGIDDTGRLILDTGLGTKQLFAAGDVFFG